jgi:hypothetical protein
LKAPPGGCVRVHSDAASLAILLYQDKIQNHLSPFLQFHNRLHMC